MGKYKKKNIRRTANSKFQALPVNAVLTLGALGSETVISTALTQLADDFWFQSADLSWAMELHTAGEGAISVGLANGDLSVTEIKEAINSSPTSRSDIVAREQARWPVRKVGIFPGLVAEEVLQDGRQIRTTIKMYLAEEKELVFYAMNISGGAFTTGTVIRVYGNLYGEWR